MNLSSLYELRERFSTSVIAGTYLIVEDFRLARAVEQIKPLAAMAPIFNKIYEMAQLVIKEECENRVGMLLDTIALLDAVLCTQASLQEKEEVTPIQVVEGNEYIEISYRTLQPIIKALTETGGGRYRIIEEAYKKDSSIFQDYRLKGALVKALSDSYVEIADMVETWLLKENKTIIPLLKRNLDPTGKKDMARRIHIIEEIAKETENEYYLSLLPKAEKIVREAVITALRHKPENETLLFDLVKTEKGACKQAAQYALCFFHSNKTYNYWKTTLKKETNQCVKILNFVSSEMISDIIAENLMELFHEIIKKGKVDKTQISQFWAYCNMMLGKDSEKICDLYYFLGEQKEKLDFIGIPENSNPIGDNYYMNGNVPVGKRSRLEKGSYNIVDLFSDILTDAIIYAKENQKRLNELARELYKRYREPFAPAAFLIGLLEDKKEEVFETFSPLFMRGDSTKKESKEQKKLRSSLMSILGMISYNKDTKEQAIVQYFWNSVKEQNISKIIPLKESLDERWYAVFVDPKLEKKGTVYYTAANGYYSTTTNFDRILMDLADLSSEVCIDILGEYFCKRAIEHSGNTQLQQYCFYLGYLEYKKCRGVIAEGIRERAKSQKVVVELSAIIQSLRILPMSVKQRREEIEEIVELSEKDEVSLNNWNLEIALKHYKSFLIEEE